MKEIRDENDNIHVLVKLPESPSGQNKSITSPMTQMDEHLYGKYICICYLVTD